VKGAISLRNNFSWVLTGNLVYAAAQWGILIMLARLGSPDMVGRFTLALAITAPVVLLCNLQLRVVYATDVRDQYRFGDYLGLRLIMITPALLVTAVIAFGLGYTREASGVIFIVGISKGFESMSDILFGVMQKQERMRRIAVSQILRGVLSFIALSVILYITGSLFWGVVAIAVVWCGLFVLFDWRNAGRILASAGESSLRPQWEWEKLFALAKLGLPVGLVSALISYYVAIPRYFLETYHGESALGYFAAIAYLPMAGLIVVDALGQSAIPRLARYYASDQLAYKRLLEKLIGVGITLGFSGILVSILFGSKLLMIIYRPEYALHANVLVLLMIAGSIVYVCSILGVALTSAGFFKVQLPILILLLLTEVASGWWLIPRFGEQGAAWTLLLGASVWFLVSGTIVLYIIARQLGKIEILEARPMPSSRLNKFASVLFRGLGD
jgi:O-antigen/teichoic acid export membrane protein